MTNTTRYARLLTATLALAACAKGDASRTDSSAADGVTSTIAPSTAGTPVDTAVLTPGGAPNAGAVTDATVAGGMLDPNTASAEQLATVPGMNTVAVNAVISGRPWARMTDVDRALAGAGLEAAARKQAYARLWKPIDLNKANRNEILLIPGVGARMAHEFEEYRPYKDLAQFDREIGKYVNKAEVARLRQYVSLR